MKPKNQQIKFLLETDYDHFSVTPSHRSKKNRDGRAWRAVTHRKENKFLASIIWEKWAVSHLSLQRSAVFRVYFSHYTSGPRTDQQIKFLLETDYDRCSVTPIHRSNFFEMGEHGKRLLAGRRTSFLPLSLERCGMFTTYSSREVRSLEFLLTLF